MRIIKRIIPIVVLAIVGILIVNMEGKSKDRCTEPVTGTLISYNEVIDDDHSVHYFPIFQYSFNGKIFKEQANIGGEKSYADGEQVQLLVNPENPYDYIIEGQNIFLIVGWICVGIAILMFFTLVLNILGIGQAMSTGTAGVGTAAILAMMEKAKAKREGQDHN